MLRTMWNGALSVSKIRSLASLDQRLVPWSGPSPGVDERLRTRPDQLPKRQDRT